MDPAKRAALFIKMNDLVVKDGHIIPLISRPRVSGGIVKLVTAPDRAGTSTSRACTTGIARGARV